MSEEKQIEEMAKVIDEFTEPLSAREIHKAEFSEQFAEALYNAGYRKQSEGENIAEVHPVDEFVCSECGIDLEGWTRVVTDEDDGDKLFYEYEFKYCPNCGAKMKGERPMNTNNKPTTENEAPKRCDLETVITAEITIIDRDVVMGEEFNLAAVADAIKADVKEYFVKKVDDFRLDHEKIKVQLFLHEKEGT